MKIFSDFVLFLSNLKVYVIERNRNMSTWCVLTYFSVLYISICISSLWSHVNVFLSVEIHDDCCYIMHSLGSCTMGF